MEKNQHNRADASNKSDETSTHDQHQGQEEAKNNEQKYANRFAETSGNKQVQDETGTIPSEEETLGIA